MSQSILVYGAGGVGSLFGALLVRAGQDVSFVARGAQLEAFQTTGLRIRSPFLGDFDVSPVTARATAAGQGAADVVLVAVKTHQTASVLDDLAGAVGDQTVLVTLQNGVESDEVLAGRFGAARVVPAVVYVGATVEEPGLVRQTAGARVSIGARAGFDVARLPAIRDLLATSGQQVQISENIQRERWRKLAWNASFNSVSAMTSRTPVELLAIPEARALLVEIMGEVVTVACALGVDLRASDIDDHLAWTARADALRTSTMVDRERGRAMEADGLLGVVVRKGRQAGIETPACRALYALMTAADGGASGGR